MWFVKDHADMRWNFQSTNIFQNEVLLVQVGSDEKTVSFISMSEASATSLILTEVPLQLLRSELQV